jgi:putative restriction endonuclease
MDTHFLDLVCTLTVLTTMRIFVGVTDKDWFTLHASQSRVDEVNFWRPSPNATFKALDPGELLLFKLHSPDNYIVGGGFFTKFQQLPVNMAWDAFRQGNGVSSLEEMRLRIGYYRRMPIAPNEKPCSVSAEIPASRSWCAAREVGAKPSTT